MNKRRILLLIIGSLFNTIIFSQTQNASTGLPNIFPVSPKAFEFMKYTEVPVSKYTGVPDISIPIYNIKLNGLEIPISLGYHSNGFRVNEEAGWTGLGWSLNAGGSIVQVVNGYDDYGIFQNRINEAQSMVNASIAGGNTGMPQGILSQCTTVNFPIFCPTPHWVNGGESKFTYGIPYSNAINFNEDSRLLTGLKDINPDIFKFNMMGYSGEFMMDWSNGNYVCLNDKNIKIDGSGAPANFTITTPDGNRFLFQLKEETIIGKNYQEALNPTGSLDLDKLVGEKSSRVYQITDIITSGGDLVKFDYIQTNTIENIPFISQSKMGYSFSNITTTSGFKPSITDIFTNQPAGKNIQYSKQSFSYLTTISFPEGKIYFNSTDDRVDCIGMRKLNSINITDLQNNIFHVFKLSYDDFVGHTLGNNNDQYLNNSNIYLTGKQSTETTHRLKLLSVTENGKPPYLFEYDPTLLPRKTSLAQDLFGYYNGQLNNTNLFPNIYSFGIPDVNIDISGLSDNNMSDLVSTKAAVLNKITYPTGGISEFDYDLNSFDNFKVPDKQNSILASGLLINENNPGDNTTQVFSVDVPSLVYGYNGGMSISTVGNTTTNGLGAYIRLTILKKTAANQALVASSGFLTTYNNTSLGNPNKANQLSTYINDIVNDSRYLGFDFDNTSQSYGTMKHQNEFYLDLSPDNIYIIQAYIDPSFGTQASNSKHASAIVWFKFLQNKPHTISYGAGLRVKSIISRDPMSPPLIKQFSYSGGKLMTPLIYVTKDIFDFEHTITHSDGCPTDGCPRPICCPADCLKYYYQTQFATVTKTTISSSNFYSASFNASGKYVGYSTVTENNVYNDPTGKIITNANGLIEESYTNYPDVGGIDPALIPSTLTPNAVNPLNYLYPSQKASTQNGLLLNRKIINSNNDVLSEITNSYSTQSSCLFYGRISGYAGQTSKPGVDQPCGLVDINPKYFVGFYPIMGNKTLLANTTDNTYSVFSNSGATNTLTDSKFFTYCKHDMLSKTTETNSKKQVVVNNYVHPCEDGSNSAFNFLTMYKAANFITPVVEHSLEIDGKRISTQRNEYSANYAAFLLNKSTLSKGNNPLEDNIVFDVYGDYKTPSKYKLQQYHTRDGINTNILWGYNGQYPVAKIVGSTYSAASSLVDQTVLDNATASTDVALRLELNKLRSLSNCFVTTYTYKPLVGLSSETDPNNRTIYYEYDLENRLKLTRDKDNNILKGYSYNNYAGLPEYCLGETYYNYAKSKAFIRNNCTTGLLGGIVYYTVPSNKFSSTISQADADAQADADISQNGQNFANSNTTCSIPTTIVGTSNFSSTYTSGTGTIVGPPGTKVIVKISATGLPNYTQTLNITITGVVVTGSTTITNGNSNFTFIMPTSGIVNWSATFSAPNSICSGSITVQ